MTKHVHGGNIYTYKNCLDFSANCNPLGTPESVKQAVRDSLEYMKDYPQVGYAPLKKAIAEYEGVASESVICGNGAAELVFSLCQAVKPKKALIPVPTFAEYEQALTSCGCEVEHVLLREEEGFSLQDSFINWLHRDLDMVFLCNPNNPTGISIDREFLFRVLRVCREMDILLVVDECFLDFTGQEDKLSYVKNILRYRGLFVLKAFTKMYAIPGIRLGYGITYDKELIGKMYDAGQPWNVSVLAQNAGIAALDEDKFAADTVSLISKEREFICTNFQRMNIKHWKSCVNYIFFMHKKGLKEELLNRGILIRDCSDYKNLTDGYYRIAIKSHKDNVKLIDALADIDIN